MPYARTALISVISILTIALFAGCDTAPVNTGIVDDEQSGRTEYDKEADEARLEAEALAKHALSNQIAMPKTGDKIAVIETGFGTIKMKLFTEQVPEMSKNFEELANAGNYDGAPFHRVVKDFMIQTGDFTNQNGTGGHSYKGEGTRLPDEIVGELVHAYGTVSMANSGPNTNGSQFFIVTNKQGTPFLDGGYTIFGQVFEGMDVAVKIQDLQVPGTEQPSETVNMEKVTIETL